MSKAWCQARYSGPLYRPASNVFGSGTEATFSEVNATLPSLLCRFVAPDQAGQIMASIFTCLCNYNTEICGMAMAQTVVPVYTIPNTYRVQQSLWESLCRIIPGIAHTSESELHSFEPTAPRNILAGHSDTVPSSGKSGGLGTGTVGSGNPPNVAVSLPTCKKDVTQGMRSTGLPDGIPLAGSKWALFPPHMPTINLADGGNPPDANPARNQHSHQSYSRVWKTPFQEET